MIAALPMTPDSGKPPASDLATVIRSGSTPETSMPNILPVRAKPVWISSAIMTMPLVSHIWRIASSSSTGAGWKPPSPWTGSMIMAATWVGSMSARNRNSSARSVSATVTPLSGVGNGRW